LVTNVSPADLNELLNQGLSIEVAAAQLGISRATAYRWKQASQ
jgi:transposase